MPYETNEDLPPRVKDNVPSEKGKTLFREVFNSQMSNGRSEAVSFASAWAALQNAGYEESSSGKWVKKMSPAPSDVHVSSTEWEKSKKYKLPEKARQNARKVLQWKREHGNEVKGMTEVGWRRARQLADNESVGAETVKAMAQFNRHRKNAKIADEHKGEPWKDAGYVAWLGWGGDAGIDWAIKQSDKMEKRQINDDVFTEPMEAQARSIDLGLHGHFHAYAQPGGQAVYMPGETHEQYMQAMNAKANPEPKPEKKRGIMHIVQELVRAVVGDPPEVSETTGHEFIGRVLKVDDEQRIVYGWASVVTENGDPVVDTQGDIIPPDEMVKAVNEFMADERVGKTMHKGEQIGTVLHSLPLTGEIAKALGIDSHLEGWVVGMKIESDEVWKSIKEGKFSGFSIGGQAHRVAIDD